MRFGFYGSLRKGFYNYDRFKLDKNAKFIEAIELQGYAMYDLGSYPAIKKTNEDSDNVYLEIYEIKDNYISDMIDRMELGAGYTAKDISIKGDKVRIYVMAHIPQTYDKIKNGIWE